MVWPTTQQVDCIDYFFIVRGRDRATIGLSVRPTNHTSNKATQWKISKYHEFLIFLVSFVSALNHNIIPNKNLQELLHHIALLHCCICIAVVLKTYTCFVAILIAIFYFIYFYYNSPYPLKAYTLRASIWRALKSSCESNPATQ